MLLFSDGFDYFDTDYLGMKWGRFHIDETYKNNVKIVYGNDQGNGGKPFATKNGRALHCFGNDAFYVLSTVFRPSRTIFIGFAMRSVCQPSMRTWPVISINLRNRMIMDRGRRLYESLTNANGLPLDLIGLSANISFLTMSFTSPYRISINWEFGNQTVKVGDINSEANLLNGDYHYFQIGCTLNGNIAAQPQAWAEVRIGNKGDDKIRFDNTLTSAPDGTGEMYMNYVALRIKNGYATTGQSTSMTIDDFYICNDEGSFNNTFLGNVKVRSALPIANGAVNQGIPVGSTMRYDCVDEPFLGDRALPAPLPTPETDPTFIPWEDPSGKYIELERKSDRQLFRFTDPGWEGSLPKIFGTVLFAMARSKYRATGGAATLRGVKSVGLMNDQYADADMPVSFARFQMADPFAINGEWQTMVMPFDNNEGIAEGHPDILWGAQGIQFSDWGFELVECTLSPESYGQLLYRQSMTFYEALAETISSIDYPSRHHDEAISDGLAFDELHSYERTITCVEWLYFDESLSNLNLHFNRSVNDTLEVNDDSPWTYLWAHNLIELSDSTQVDFLNNIDDSLSIQELSFGTRIRPDGTGDAYEDCNALLSMTDENAISFLFYLDDTFGLEEPYLWNGHEDIEETLEISVSYIWSGHESAEEYVGIADDAAQGIGMDIEDVIGFEEDHFDGWWVELFQEQMSINVSVLTQQWRHERIFGIIVNSYQIEPIEQPGAMDGYRVGDNPEGW